jgi:predicted acyltransferase
MFAGIAARLLGMVSVGQSSLQSWLFSALYQPLFGDYNGSLAFALSFLLVSYLLMHWCYKRGYIFKV